MVTDPDDVMSRAGPNQPISIPERSGASQLSMGEVGDGAYTAASLPIKVKGPRAANCLWEITKKVLRGNAKLPQWFVRGRTVPKAGCKGLPEQYRPITCLNTGYKLFTSVLTAVLLEHCEKHGIIPQEQRALRTRRRGCLDALVIDSMVAREATLRKKDLSVAWIDYRKVYDRVPHAWLLRTIKAPPYIQTCIAELLPLWKSEFRCGFGRNSVRANLVYRRGEIHSPPSSFASALPHSRQR